jgi:hypothetical protein
LLRLAHGSPQEFETAVNRTSVFAAVDCLMLLLLFLLLE